MTASPMPTVDERARAIQRRYGLHRGDDTKANQALAAIHFALTATEITDVDALTTAINQLDEARAVVLEEAARIVEDAPAYKGGLCLITTPQLVEAIRALGNLTATSEGVVVEPATSEDAISRLRKAAYQDEAKSITVSADDLRITLAQIAATQADTRVKACSSKKRSRNKALT